MVLPAGMYVTSCSEPRGGCDTVVLPSKAALSNLKLSCPGAKLFVVEKTRRERACVHVYVRETESDRNIQEFRYPIYLHISSLEQNDSVFVIRPAQSSGALRNHCKKSLCPHGRVTN